MIPDIIARLTGAGTPFAISGGAGALADVKDVPNATPAVYVYTAEERSAPSDSFGRVLQRTMATIAVVIVTSNLSDENNGEAADDIEALKAFCRAKLIGWSPTANHQAFEHAAGELQQALAGTVWFEDQFTTAFYQEETA